MTASTSGATTPRAPAQTLSGDESLELPEFEDPPADPIRLLRDWLAAAGRAGVREPRAMVLATADAAGRPSSRVLLLKEVTEDSLVFTSHTGSRKGRDITQNPYAAATLYWRETLQQLTASGPVEPMDDAGSDALFAERPRAAQATTVASQQGQLLLDEQALARRAGELLDQDGPLTRPNGWRGYRLRPETVEFWQGRSSRLHRRLLYTRNDNVWTPTRLQP